MPSFFTLVVPLHAATNVSKSNIDNITSHYKDDGTIIHSEDLNDDEPQNIDEGLGPAINLSNQTTLSLKIKYLTKESKNIKPELL